MKKQLLRVLSLAAGVLTITACSSEYDFESKYNTETERDKVFNEIFVETFGEPDAYHTWGFERPETAETRAVNKNGNQWHDSNYFDLAYDPVVTEEEKIGVFNYVNKDVNYIETVEQENWSEYWISQVWDGENDANASNVKAPLSVPFSGESDAIAGAAHMDYLHVKESASQGDDIASWTHFNDFNSANNEGNYEGGKLYMYESGTLSFGYHNSYCDFYSDKYIVVSGATIFGTNSQYANYYYVCFDFEGTVSKEQTRISGNYKTTHTWVNTDSSGNGDGYEEANLQNVNFEVDGLYTTETLTNDVIDAAVATAYQNNSYVDGNGYHHTYTATPDYNSFKANSWVNGNKHFDGDNNFTDWIVRISPAKHNSVEPEIYARRVIAEDLGTAEATDFDYNDVVFDVVWDDATGTGTTITLKAAGGTLPLRLIVVDDDHRTTSISNPATASGSWVKLNREVHDWFDVSTSTMVNTGIASAPEKSEHYSGKIYADNVRIFVQKDNEWYEITAEAGEPAEKLAAGTDYPWMGERISITTKTEWYHNFLLYVANANVWGKNSYKKWYTSNPQKEDDDTSDDAVNHPDF